MKKVIYSIFALSILIACNQPVAEDVATVKSSEMLENETVVNRLKEEHALFKSAYADSVNNGLRPDDAFKGSARRIAKENINGTTVTINYGSPGKRGRVIWNGLVSYDQVWVSGSHWATAVSFDKNVIINQVEIPAGMYAFFTIPGRETWELIINKVYDQHLADEYNENYNLASVLVEPISLKNEVQRLTYKVETVNDKNVIALEWDKIRVEMPFETIE